MSTELNPFQQITQQIGQEVQAEVTGEPVVPTTTTAAPSATPAPTAGGEKLVLGKFKTEEEATKAHHLLIHGSNAQKAKIDELEAKLSALSSTTAPAPAPLSPGRVDPAQPTSDDQKWIEQYGILPADIDARIERKSRELREAEQAPMRAMQAADAYMAVAHPEFKAKTEDVTAFVVANPTLRDRLADLWGKGLYAEALEIGYLAYDNTLRSLEIAAGAAQTVQSRVGGERDAATLISSQAGGSREVVPSQTDFPRTPEDWQRIRDLRAAGKDEEVRKILYGGILAGIPFPGMQR